MARVLSFVAFSDQRRRCPSSPDYSPTTAALSPRAASPEYTPVSLHWRRGSPDEHAPSTTLRLGPSTSPLCRAASPDYSPSSSPSRPRSPEYTPLDRCGWRAGSPDYAPSTPMTSRDASPEYTPLDRYGWRAGSPDYASPTPATSRSASSSPDYAPSTPTTYRVASPEYTPVSRLWREAGSPDYRPSDPPAAAAGAGSPGCALASPPRRAASPDYTPQTPPARAPPPQSPDYSPSPLPPSPLVPNAESGMSPARRYLRRTIRTREAAPPRAPGALVGSTTQPAPSCLLGGSVISSDVRSVIILDGNTFLSSCVPLASSCLNVCSCSVEHMCYSITHQFCLNSSIQLGSKMCAEACLFFFSISIYKSFVLLISQVVRPTRAMC